MTTRSSEDVTDLDLLRMVREELLSPESRKEYVISDIETVLSCVEERIAELGHSPRPPSVPTVTVSEAVRFHFIKGAREAGRLYGMAPEEIEAVLDDYLSAPHNHALRDKAVEAAQRSYFRSLPEDGPG